MAKILLVEDDNNLREIYEARLQAEGYTIASAHDGEEALVVAKEQKPDLVISDVMMPKISGFEMLDIMRNTDELKDVKVIMLTALGQSEDQQRADRLGADRYLVKSQVTLEDIVKVAQDLLTESSSKQTEQVPVPGVETASAAMPPATNPAPVPATDDTTTPVVEPPTEPSVSEPPITPPTEPAKVSSPPSITDPDSNPEPSEPPKEADPVTDSEPSIEVTPETEAEAVADPDPAPESGTSAEITPEVTEPEEPEETPAVISESEEEEGEVTSPPVGDPVSVEDKNKPAIQSESDSASEPSTESSSETTPEAESEPAAADPTTELPKEAEPVLEPEVEDTPVTPPVIPDLSESTIESSESAVADEAASDPLNAATAAISDTSSIAQSAIDEADSVEAQIEDFVTGATTDPGPAPEAITPTTEPTEATFTPPVDEPLDQAEVSENTADVPSSPALASPEIMPPQSNVISPQSSNVTDTNNDQLMNDAVDSLVANTTGTSVSDTPTPKIIISPQMSTLESPTTGQSAAQSNSTTSPSTDKPEIPPMVSGKKIISPLNSEPRPDLGKLLALEDAKQIISQSPSPQLPTNPAPADETIDPNSIAL